MLFQRCLDMKLLHIAASYLIILQNMEPVTISRQHATVLLDAALDACAWDLAKDLVRFLRAIDPSDVDPCSSLAGVTSGSSAASVVGSAAGAVVVASGGSGTTGAVGGAGAALLRVASHGPPQTPPVSPNEEDLNFLLGIYFVHLLNNLLKRQRMIVENYWHSLLMCRRIDPPESAQWSNEVPSADQQ